MLSIRACWIWVPKLSKPRNQVSAHFAVFSVFVACWLGRCQLSASPCLVLGAAGVSQPDSNDLHGTGGNECFPANSFHSYQHFPPAQSSFIGVCRCFCNDSNTFPKNKSHARIHFNFPHWLAEAWYISTRWEPMCTVYGRRGLISRHLSSMGVSAKQKALPDKNEFSRFPFHNRE